MSNPGVLGAISYEAESVFGETTATTATLRIPQVMSQLDVSGIIQNKVPAQRLAQHLNTCPGYVLGTMGGSFKTKTFLTGHGSTTAAATAATAYETWLGLIFGNGAVSAASGSTFTGAGTAVAPTTTSSGTFAAGSIGWAGALNDGRGGGQAFAVSTHAATTLNLLTGLAVAPSAADALYSGFTFYLPETTYTVASQRMLLQTTNLQYLCHGCYPTAISISGLSPGELPTLEVTWNIAWYEYKASTFPSAVTGNTDNPAPVASGTIWTNAVGTATNATRSTARGFTIDVSLGMETLKGFGSPNAFADIVGARRTPSQIKISWTEDADAATTTPVIPGLGTGTTNRHVLYNANTTDSKRFAAYFPNVEASAVAVQKVDSNLNRVTYQGHASVSSTTTNDLTLSAMRLAFG